MTIHTKRYRVKPGRPLRLKTCPTRIKPLYDSKEEYEQLLHEHIERLSSLQSRLFASDRYGLLLLFQAMDAAGKDSAIKHVMSGVNPQGCRVYSFKRPTATELRHDFLWRTTLCLPERGMIGIFNRSYYEEVLVVRVHQALLQTEVPPEELRDRTSIWNHRFRSMIEFERHLHRNGTRIIKLFLHLSKEEQRKRFLARIDEPHKSWKFSVDDLAERKHWKEYRKAYEECLQATSTHHSPWYVVPADDKENAQLIISQIVVDHLESLGLHYPEPDAKRLRELAQMRRIITR